MLKRYFLPIYFALAVGITAFLAGGFGGVQAQSPTECPQRAVVAATLAEQHNEVSIWAGVSTSGHVVEIFANAGRTSFTVVLVHRDGQACLADAGGVSQTITSPKKKAGYAL